MSDLEKRDFVKPYPQEHLGGELGLNSEDLAKALGVRHDVILEKLRRTRKDQWESVGWGFTVYTVKPPKGSHGGRPKQIYSLNLKCAKAFVAKWENLNGYGYLNYLFDCERQAEQLLPRMKAALEAFMAPRKRRTPRGIMVKVQRPILQLDLFGEWSCNITTLKKLYSELSPEELDLYQMRHSQKVVQGIVNKQTKRIEKGNLTLLPGKQD